MPCLATDALLSCESKAKLKLLSPADHQPTLLLACFAFFACCRALGTVLVVAVPPLLVAYLRGLSPLPEERRLDALPGDVGSGERWGGAQGRLQCMSSVAVLAFQSLSSVWASCLPFETVLIAPCL